MTKLNQILIGTIVGLVIVFAIGIFQYSDYHEERHLKSGQVAKSANEFNIAKMDSVIYILGQKRTSANKSWLDSARWILRGRMRLMFKAEYDSIYLPLKDSIDTGEIIKIIDGVKDSILKNNNVNIDSMRIIDSLKLKDEQILKTPLPMKISGLVFWMNEKSFYNSGSLQTTNGGTITDIKNYLGDGLDATQINTGATLSVSGALKGLSLDGTQFFSFGDPAALNFTGNFTFVWRIRSSGAASGTGTVISQAGSTTAQRQYYVVMNQQDFHFQTGTSSNTITGQAYSFPINGAVVADGTNGRKYVNNVEVGAAFTLQTPAGDTDVLIGSRTSTTGSATTVNNPFNGILEQLMVFNRALTGTERTALNTYLNNSATNYIP